MSVTADPSPARLSIYEAASANRWRTVLLIAVFTALVAVLAYFVGEYFAPGGGVAALPFALAIAGGSALVSYFAGDKLILAQSQARELGPEEDLKLRDVVESLALGLGIPTPKIYMIEDSAPNAFATGRDPQHASVVVTRGLLDKLDRTELEGVIAHELSHVGNHDIRVMVLVTVLVGTVALLADWVWRPVVLGGCGGPGPGRGGAVMLVIAIGAGAAAGIVTRPTPTPVPTPVPTPIATPTPEPDTGPLVFQQPLTAGCASDDATWVVSDGGGIGRFDGRRWQLIDSTLRSLVAAACAPDSVFAIGAFGRVVTIAEVSQTFRSDGLGFFDTYANPLLPD